MTPVPVDHVRSQTPYEVPSLAGPIDLHLEGNEGSLPPPDWVAALAPYGPDLVRRYPGGTGLDELLADTFGVAPAQVLLTAGADDALDRVFRAMVAPGHEVLLTTPTFEMIERFARLARGRTVAVPWLEGPFPLDGMLAQVRPTTTVIAVVTPNNPTGLTVSVAALKRLSDAAPHATLLVDMAYGEFADEDIAPSVLQLPNAIMIRTFSKAWGFAGLRVGYAVGPVELIDAMRVAGPPYPLSGPSVALVTNRYLYEREAVDGFVTQVRQERQALVHLLQTLGAAPWPSEGNFVLARFKDPHWVWQGLGGLGIAVRPFPGRANLGDSLRITCPGDAARFERLQHALQAVMAPQALLFDLDGVLADVSESYRQAIVDTAASWKVLVTPKDISTLKAKGSANNDWEVTWRLITARGVQVSQDEVTERFERMYQGTPETPGLWTRERFLWERQALETLSRKLPLGIVTGRPRRDAHRFLQENGVFDIFKTIVCMEDGPIKPDPAPVRRALQHMGVTAAWMVGDTPDDMLAARRAGVVPIGILAPQDERDDTVLRRAGAARVLDSLEGLIALL